MTRNWIIAAGFTGFIAVAFGAFAVHGLEDQVSERALAAIKTGSDYALLHAAALLGLAALSDKGGRIAMFAGWAFVIGVALFSGSVFVFGLSEFTAHLWITPVGGACLLAGWALVVISGLKAGMAKVVSNP